MKFQIQQNKLRDEVKKRIFDEFGKERNCNFAFVETMSFQAPGFYQKMGFKIEFSRPGYAKNICFHYLKKDLKGDVDVTIGKQVTRLGVYGVSIKDGCRSIREQPELQHIWIDPKTLAQDQCSSLLWKYKQIHIDG